MECAIPPLRSKSKGDVTLSVQQVEEENKIDKLLLAVDEGDQQAVSEWIGREMELGVNVADESGLTAVHRACSQKETSLNILKYLLDAGAYCDYPVPDSGKRPIEIAIENGGACTKHIDMLLKLKRSDDTRVVDLTAFNSKSGNSLLHSAAWFGNDEAMEALLATGAFAGRLEETNKQGQTAMHVASFRSPKSVVQMLKEAGADVNAVEKNKRRMSKETPAMMATSMGRMDNAEYLNSFVGVTNSLVFASRIKKKHEKKVA